MKRGTNHLLILSTAILALGPPATRADVFNINSKAAYLHTNNDPTGTFAVPIDLFSLSFSVSAGDFLQLTRLGDFSERQDPVADDRLFLFALFSSSTTLLTASDLNRLPDAIDAGTDFVSPNTFSGNQPTDIPQDFTVDSGDGVQTNVVIQVPTGGRYLFVATDDTFLGDNSDPDGDFAIQISTVPEPPTALFGVIGVLGLCFRRKRASKVAS